MSSDLIKKKIQLYVSETGESKVAKYYRIPIPSDSMEYSRENNAYKGCVRWYARVSGDRISFAQFARTYPGVVSTVGNRDNSVYRAINIESIKALEPIIPDSLLNDKESSFSLKEYSLSDNTVVPSNSVPDTYLSSIGYVNKNYFSSTDLSNKRQNVTISKDAIFLPFGVVTSDKYADLSSKVPTNWVEMGTIDSIKSEVEAFLNGDDTIDRGPMYDFEKLLSDSIYRDNKHQTVYPSYIVDDNPKAYGRKTFSFNLSQDSGNLLLVKNKGGKLVNNTLNINVNTTQLGNGAVYIVYKLLNEDVVKSNTYTKEYFSSHPNILISDFDRYDILAAFVNDTNINPISFEGGLDTTSAPDYRRLNDRLTKFATNREVETLDNDFDGIDNIVEKEFLNYKSSENSIEVVIDGIGGIKDIVIDLDTNNKTSYIDAITKDGHFKAVSDSITGPITITELADVHSLVISGFNYTDEEQLRQSVYINKIKVTKVRTSKDLFDFTQNKNKQICNKEYDEYSTNNIIGYANLDLSDVPVEKRNLKLDNISNTDMGLRVIHKDENSDNYIDTHMTILEFKKYVLDHITVDQFAVIADDKNFEFSFRFQSNNNEQV